MKRIKSVFMHGRSSPIVLRLKSDERVETSRGAIVPLWVCKWLYEAFKA